MKSTWTERISWRIIGFILAGLLAAVAYLWRNDLWRLFGERDALLSWLDRLGPWGPLFIVLGQVLQVLIAPIPGQAMGLAAGYLYGVFWGTVICLVGLTLGSWLAMWLARRLGRPLVERYASKDLLERVDRYAQRRGALAFLLIFLLPFLPDDACCFVAGLTPLPISQLVILAFVGRAPGVIVSTWIGAQAKSLTWLQMGIIGGVALALALALMHYQERLEKAVFYVLDRYHAKS